ncbi:MAG: FtsH protease activity modulator HflK [Gammaproteobacteria bacterium]|nr:FtsH protease activity modulator HflK [Gammaproteobacteria bacterium]
MSKDDSTKINHPNQEMAWNEPGGSGNGPKDPWGNKGGSQDGPPDLDEVFKKLNEKVTSLFGGKGGRSGGGSSTAGGSKSFGFIVTIALVVWALSGIYIIDEGRQGVVLRVGAFDRITEPGPHWYPRFIEKVEIVDVDRVRSINIGATTHESLMLTKDENIVDIQFAVQYKVSNAKDYVFNVRDPDTTLRQVTETAMREIVGKNNMDFVIKDGRVQVASGTKELMQNILNGYKTGLIVTNVNMQNAQPPEQVQHAFSDAVKAREDKERLVNEAEAYSNDILPRARGKAARMEQEAAAYRDQIIAKANGETERFLKVLVQYKKAPIVTRERLYLETMESVLGNSNKVMVDVKKGNNLMYLPLDRLQSRQGSGLTVQDLENMKQSLPDSTNNNSTSRTRDSLRGREGR